MSKLIELEEYSFDATSGELFAAAGNGAAKERLAPQPAQLLTLLIEHHPEIVSRENIQEQIWPGVKTEFDNSLHFCVRQIRAALGDSATKPKYVETIPRRGYRLIVEPVKTNSTDDNQDGDNSGSDNHHVDAADEGASLLTAKHKSQLPANHKSPKAPPLIFTIAAAVVISLSLIVLFVLNKYYGDHLTIENDKDDRPVRIAIMPFQSNSPVFKHIGSGSLSTRLLESFADDFGDRIDAVGPTTTKNYAENQLQQLIDDVEPIFIINGRFVESAGESFLLVEIIRADDGAHVWVQRYLPDADENEISAQTRQALLKYIE